MSSRCELCGKKPSSGKSVSRRGLAKKKKGAGRKTLSRSNRVFKPNLQRVRVLVDGKVARIRVCTECIRSNRVAKAP